MKKVINYALIFFVIIVMQLSLITNTGKILSLIITTMSIVSYILETYNKFEQKTALKIVIYIAVIITTFILTDDICFVINVATIGNIIFNHIKKECNDKEFYVFNAIILILGIVIEKIISNEMWVIRYIATYIVFILFIYESSKKVGKVEFKYSDIIGILCGFILSITLSIYCIATINNAISTNEKIVSILDECNKKDIKDINRAIDDILELTGSGVSASDKQFGLITSNFERSLKVWGEMFISLKTSNLSISKMNEYIEDYIKGIESVSIVANMVIEKSIKPVLISSVIVYSMSIIIIYYKNNEFNTYN